MELKFGCDPELFVKNSRGQLISAFGLVPGTKTEPKKVEFGAVQVDGMALEFNIEPVTNVQDWLRNIRIVQGNLKGMIPSSYKFVYDPVARFGKEYIDNQPPVAKTLGCDPDFNAYTGLPNPTPNANGEFRTASGHIHIGWTENESLNDPEHLEACRMVTWQLDRALALFEELWCEPNERRELYGNLGAFRPKPYGVEYRVLNNSWLRSEKLQAFVFEVANKAINHLYDGTVYYNRARPHDIAPLSRNNISSWYDWLTFNFGPIGTRIFDRKFNDTAADLFNYYRHGRPRRMYLL